MSTRATIGRKNEDGTVTAIYSHFDGYIEGVGETLQLYYQDAAKVDALMALGDVSALGTEIGEQHDFNDRYSDQDPRAQWCRAYGRDRGEDGTEAKIFESDTAYWAARRSFGAEFQYLFDGGQWLVKPYDREIRPLADVLSAQETKAE